MLLWKKCKSFISVFSRKLDLWGFLICPIESKCIMLEISGNKNKKKKKNLFATMYSQFCNNACLQIANLFQQDWYTREQFERNVTFTFACSEFLMTNSRWTQKTTPSWTELWRNFKNTHKHTSQTSHFPSQVMTQLWGTCMPTCITNFHQISDHLSVPTAPTSDAEFH